MYLTVAKTVIEKGTFFVKDIVLLKLKSERSRAIIFLIITAILWSLGGVLIKSIEWNPVAIAGMRSIIAAIVLLIVIKKPKLTWSFAQIGAAVAYSGTVILFVMANKITTAANAILLQYTAPIYVALFGAWFLKEKAKFFDWLIIFTVFGGMALFFLDHLNGNGVLGNIVAVGSGVCFGFFAIFMRMQKDGSPIESVLLGNILTAVIAIPFMFKSPPNTQGWIYLLIMGVVQLGIPYILYSMAIKHVTALEAILIPVIEPILNPVWVFLMIGETPGPWAILGGAIVIIAVTLRCGLATFR
ncbi:MAG: DMT family transporter [Clostridiaceae bacterium]|nr:DMT family transporter [Clostridiaceae bacterium]